MKYVPVLLLVAFILLHFSGCSAQPSLPLLPGSTQLPTLEPLPTRTPFPTITLTPAPTATKTRVPSSTPTLTSTPTLSPTAVPVGTFAIFFYQPLVLSYDPQVWLDKSVYGDTSFIVNYLQAEGLSTCTVSVQGSTDFNGPAEDYIWGEAQLGEIQYATLQFTEPGPLRADFYFAEDPIEGYDSSVAVPILVISANEEEWEACKTAGEEVLATLHAGGVQ